MICTVMEARFKRSPNIGKVSPRNFSVQTYLICCTVNCRNVRTFHACYSFYSVSLSYFQILAELRFRDYGLVVGKNLELGFQHFHKESSINNEHTEAIGSRLSLKPVGYLMPTFVLSVRYKM